jgi:ribosomal protein L44E
MNVYFVDGNKKNVNPINLKTVCANCQRLTSVKRLGWRMGDLQADD